MNERIQKLLRLAEVSQEFEFVDLDLVNHFSSLREELGLAKLLLLIQQYARTQNQESQSLPPTSETIQPNQNSAPL